MLSFMKKISISIKKWKFEEWVVEVVFGEEIYYNCTNYILGFEIAKLAPCLLTTLWSNACLYDAGIPWSAFFHGHRKVILISLVANDFVLNEGKLIPGFSPFRREKCDTKSHKFCACEKQSIFHGTMRS